MSNQAVGNVYQTIIEEVINSSRVDFEESGVEEAVLEELRLVSTFASVSLFSLLQNLPSGFVQPEQPRTPVTRLRLYLSRDKTQQTNKEQYRSCKKHFRDETSLGRLAEAESGDGLGWEGATQHYLAPF